MANLIEGTKEYTVRKFDTRINVHGTTLNFTFVDSRPTESSVIAYLISKIEKIDYDRYDGDLLFYTKSASSGTRILEFWFAIEKDKIPNCEFEIGEYDTAKTSAAIILNAPEV